MRTNWQNLLKKLASVVGVASASALLSLPALAQSNPNINIFNGPQGNRAHGGQFTPGSRQLFAQSTTGGSSTDGSQTPSTSPQGQSNPPSEVPSPSPQYLDPNPPAEVPSPSLIYLDPSSAMRPSRYHGR